MRVCPFPSAFWAQNGHLEIVQMLLMDDRVDATVNSNEAIRTARIEKYIAMVHWLLEWTGRESEKVNPISTPEEEEDLTYTTVDYVEDNILELEKKGQSGEQWNNVLHQFVSNAYVNKVQLLEWGLSRDWRDETHGKLGAVMSAKRSIVSVP